MTSISRVEDIVPGDVISFSLYGSLYPAYSEVRVVGVTLGTYLRAVDTAATRHANLRYAFSNIEYQDTFSSYNYLTVRTQSLSTDEVGLPWIIPETLAFSIKRGTQYTVTDIDVNTIQTIEASLRTNGFNPVVTYNESIMTATIFVRYTPIAQTNEVSAILATAGLTFTSTVLT